LVRRLFQLKKRRNIIGITVNKDNSGQITVFFPYDYLLVQKVKTIDGHRWHPDKKHRSFPDSDGTLEKILKILEDEEIHLDTTLQAELSKSPVGHFDAKLPRLSLLMEYILQKICLF